MSKEIHVKQALFRQHVLAWYEAGDGPIVLLLHGGGGTGKAWWHQLQALSTHYRVIAVDMPGFGRSDWVDGLCSVSDLADYLHEWVTASNWRCLAIGGNSMGGRVALHWVQSYPQDAQKLLLLDAVTLILPDVPILNPLDLPRETFLQTLVFDPRTYQKRTPYRSLDDARQLARGHENFARYVACAPLAQGRADALRTLQSAVLLIWGENDRIIPIAYAHYLHKILPHSTLTILPECGHLPHLEKPEAVNALLADFLAQTF
ncbi:MAG: alpha/beta hydrolase [Firmicutes bacterium]|nr:alpha/beta hydrolase [Bacillota bacterium]